MKKMIIGADLLGKACTEKSFDSQSKYSECQQLPQERFAGFLSYVSETAGASWNGLGANDSSVSPAVEGVIQQGLSRYIAGSDGDAIERYAYADSPYSLYLYNGKHYYLYDATVQ